MNERDWCDSRTHVLVKESHESVPAHSDGGSAEHLRVDAGRQGDDGKTGATPALHKPLALYSPLARTSAYESFAPPKMDHIHL